MELEPIGHRVVVKLDKIKATYHDADSIYIPEKQLQSEQHALEQGTLIEIGPYAFAGLYDGPINLKVGDKVFFKRYEGTQHTIDGEIFKVLNDQDIFARKK